MKPLLKPIVNSPSSLTNRVLIRNNSYLSNNSEYSVNNNSSTTNASAVRKKPYFLPKIKTPRNNQVLKNANFDFFKRNNNLSISDAMSLPLRNSKSIKDVFRMIDQADQVLRERMNNNSNGLGGSRRHVRSVAIGISKGISQKNYTINLLKEQRTKINEKERIIDQVVKEFSEQYEYDYKSFIDFVAEEKRKQMLEEETMNNLKEKKDQKKASLDEETLMNKRLEENLDKRIREIYILKSYGSFLHQVFDKKFSFDEINNGESRGKNLEKVAAELIELYETKNKYEDYPKELNDTEHLIKTYILFEDKILMALKNKDLANKEVAQQKKINERELQQVKLSLLDYESDFRYLKQERNNVHAEMKNFKISQNEILETILTCIIDLGKDLGTKHPIPTEMDKDHLSDFSLYAKKTLDHLRGIEVSINDLISEIENTVEYGNNTEKILMERCIGEQRKINKREKQMKLKMIQEELKNQKNLRAIKRANKVVVAGRKAPMIFNFKNKQKKKNVKSDEKNDEKINIYDVNDDEDDSEEK